MAQCWTCKRVVDVEAVVCSSCGRPNPAKARTTEKIVYGIGAVLVGAYLLAEATSGKNEPSSQMVAQQPPAEPASVSIDALQAQDSPADIDQTQGRIQLAQLHGQEPVVASASSATPGEEEASSIVHEVVKIPRPALTSYFFQVQRDGREETVSVMAPSPERAVEILRDFRGNPPVLRGPDIQKSW